MNYENNDLRWKVSDILGFEVFDQQGNLKGILSNVILTGSNDVWVVKCYNKEILIPALKSVVKEVNFARKKIFVDLPKEYSKICSQMKLTNSTVRYNGCYVYED